MVCVYVYVVVCVHVYVVCMCVCAYYKESVYFTFSVEEDDENNTGNQCPPLPLPPRFFYLIIIFKTYNGKETK